MRSSTMRILAVTAGLLLAAAQAGAVGTDAGTNVSNTASVDFTVGGINQPDVNSNAATFLVDRRINLAVAESGGLYTDVIPGATQQVLTFTVTNTTNATLDFRLAATQDGIGISDPYGGTDDFDVSSVQVFVDATSGGTLGAYDAGDTATFIDELPEDGQRTVFIVSTIPSTPANNDTAGLTLTAYAAEPGGAGLGADVTETTNPDTANAIDTVFGDPAGDTGDIARDGHHSDDDAYRVRTATLAVTKTTRVVSDPLNLTTNPKRIPGATIEYCVAVSNTGNVAATSVVLTDVLTGQPVTFVPGSIVTEDTGTTCTDPGDTEDDGTTGTDESDPNGGSFGSNTVSVTFGSVPPSAGKAMRFQVTIN